MKNIIFIFLFCFTTFVNAQSKNTDIKTYHFNYSYIKATKSGDELFTKPWGRNVEINYDKFLQSIEIIYLDTSDKKVAIRLSYVSDASNGFWLMKDKLDARYYVLNKLDNDIFMFVLAEKTQGAVMSIIMTDSLRE